MATAHYDIFREQLAIKFPAYGHALWEPSPGRFYRAVQVGDVGYIREGKFQRLFNIMLPAEDPSHKNFGVPEYHELFKPNVPEHIDFGILRPNDFCSAGVTLDSDGLALFANGPESSAEISFSCRRKPGAVMSLPIPAKREDTVVLGDFGKWITKHIDRWFAWTRRLGLGIDRMEDIILVTGIHRTRSWINVAFPEGQADARVSFGVEVAACDDSVTINTQFSRERNRGAVLNWGPNGKDLPEDQCIFIRGFRVTRKLMILPRLRGAAGPNPDPNDYDCEPDTELISIPAVPKYRDPLHIILQYIAEAAPNCDMVIVHDDDLALLDGLGYGTSREALQPDVELSYLRSSKPLIHEVLFGSDELLPDNNSPVADAEAIRVATLSAIYQKQCRTSDSIKGRMISANDLRCPPDPTYVVSSRDLERPHPQVHPLPLSTPVLPRPRYDVSRRRQAHKPHALALRPYSDTTPSVSETSIDELDRHSLHRFTPPTSPIYATPLSAYGHAKTDIDHIKSPDDISNQLAVLEQLRRNVQKNIRLRTVPISPSPPPRSPPQPLSPTLEIPRGPSFSIDPTSVTSRLDNPIRRPLLIDTRPTAAFLGSHIKSSINFYIPSLILKRSRKPGAGFGSIDALRQFITTEPCRLAWDTLMAPGGPWDGDAIVYDEEMNPLDRLNPQVTAWALLPLIMLLVRGRAGYLEGGMLAARAHPSLQKFITSSDNSSLNAPNMVQEKFFPTPRAPKLLFPPKPIKGWNLFQSDTATAARSGIPPEIEPSEGASPVAMPTNILPGNTDSSPWNIIGASPSLPPSRSAFPRPSPPRRPSLTTLRRLDTKSAERLGPPKLQLRTLRSAIPGVSPSAGLWPGGGGGSSPWAHSSSSLTLAPSNHIPPTASAKSHWFPPNIPSPTTSPPPPNPFTTRPDLSAPPSTEEAIPTFTVSTILPNFLYLGPEITTEEDVRELESLGVRRILNIAAECDDDHGLRLRERFECYVKIPMRDTVEGENIIRDVREACEVLDDASLHSAPTYVHCKAGNSRSMTAVMAYLIHANHWTLSRAYTFVLERRKGVLPNIGFVLELINFEEAEFGVVKRPQSAGGADDGEHPDGDAHNRGAAIGIGISGRRPSHMHESLPPAWGTSTTSSLPGTARGVTGDVGQEVEVKDVNRRYRHARRAPVDEDTPQPILMRRVGKAGLENTFIDSMHPRID